MRVRLLLLVVAALVAAFFVGQPAQADPVPATDPGVVTPTESYLTTADTAAIRGILAEGRSPLPWWTISAYKYNNPGFDVAGLLAILNAESSLGRGCDYKCNPGSIKGGPVGSLWRDLRIGTSPAGYNVYPDLRAGLRAAILLIHTHYSKALASGNWYRVGAYYGREVDGYSGWLRDVKVSRARYVRMAARYGAVW
ncbi:MAG: hypothetical protein WC233_07525 [Sphaerochaeta sp.]